MEAENKEESIFEQENYEGGMGSGPLASAPEDDDDAIVPKDDETDNDEDLDIDA